MTTGIFIRCEGTEILHAAMKKGAAMQPLVTFFKHVVLYGLAHHHRRTYISKAVQPPHTHAGAVGKSYCSLSSR